MSSSQDLHGFQNPGSSATTDYAPSLHVPAVAGWRDPPFNSTMYPSDLTHPAYAFESGSPGFSPVAYHFAPSAHGATLECVSIRPLTGYSGTGLHLRIRSRQAIQLQRTRAFVASLGLRSEGRLEHEITDSYFVYYNMNAPAPHIKDEIVDQYRDAQLSVQLEDETGAMIAHCGAGSFRYEKPAQAGSEVDAKPSSAGRKRRLSIEDTPQQGPAKKASTQHLNQARRASSQRSTELGNDVAVAGSPHPTKSSSSAFALPLAADSGPGAYGPSDGQGNSLSSATFPAEQSIHSAPVQFTSMDYPGTGSNDSTSLSRFRRDAGLAARSENNPPLVRTSTVPGGSARSQPDADRDTFNPYALYQDNKAHLEIQGDLDSMTESWTLEEKTAQRRLVEFAREQEGNQVRTTFKPVTLEQRAPNSICISCIWWEERDEAFVTSVDTIQLLESLVAVRFTVEEKNRIRRNLEGFRPLTVAKGKSDSERFFKTIMDFPNPKPRNIEKDVKVFPWHILKHALKKIVGKYSASYASTQSRITQGGPSSSTSSSQTPVGSYPQHRPSLSMSNVGSPGDSYSSTPRSAYFTPHTTPIERTAMAAGPLSYPTYTAAQNIQAAARVSGGQYGGMQYPTSLPYHGGGGGGGYGSMTGGGWGQMAGHSQVQNAGAWQYPAAYGAPVVGYGGGQTAYGHEYGEERTAQYGEGPYQVQDDRYDGNYAASEQQHQQPPRR